MTLRGAAVRFWRRRRRALSRLLADRPTTIDMRALRPPLPSLGGIDKAAIQAALATASIDGGDPAALANYLQADCERFIHTVDLVPEGDGRLLEIGANPYFTSLLLRWFRPGYEGAATNFFAATDGMATQHVDVVAPGGAREHHRFDYANLNIERSAFPFADASLDGVLFCEVIEHLQMDPLHALREIWRVLKPGGFLILTTPNVARLVNVVRMIDGDGLYDPYSGHGPYGRHNREYSAAELEAVARHAGFTLDLMFSADVHGDEVADLAVAPEIVGLIKHREPLLGQYLFSRWRKGPPPRASKPSWLYQSYAEDEIEQVAPPR